MLGGTRRDRDKTEIPVPIWQRYAQGAQGSSSTLQPAQQKRISHGCRVQGPNIGRHYIKCQFGGTGAIHVQHRVRGKSSWIVALRNKFKNERRKVQNNAEVAEHRVKLGSRRRSGSTEQAELQRTKRMALQVSAQHEEAASLEKHEGGPSATTTTTKNLDEAQIKIGCNPYNKKCGS
ncbi:uncharacterized protein LOC135383039 [Ornithodoros turicata]|uniref:uncharacterized protein LOC135383039 n=1 Tax=Ornithodoros turicata TaxID=34597 RepID=UPI0031399A55